MIEHADRLKDGLLKHVETPGLQGDADGLLVLVIIQATQEHFVDNALQAWVDDLFLFILRQLSIFHPQLGVVVDAFGCSGHKIKRIQVVNLQHQSVNPHPHQKATVNKVKETKVIMFHHSPMMVSTYSESSVTLKRSPAPSA